MSELLCGGGNTESESEVGDNLISHRLRSAKVKRRTRIVATQCSLWIIKLKAFNFSIGLISHPDEDMWRGSIFHQLKEIQIIKMFSDQTLYKKVLTRVILDTVYMYQFVLCLLHALQKLPAGKSDPKNVMWRLGSKTGRKNYHFCIFIATNRIKKVIIRQLRNGYRSAYWKSGNKRWSEWENSWCTTSWFFTGSSLLLEAEDPIACFPFFFACCVSASVPPCFFPRFIAKDGEGVRNNWLIRHHQCPEGWDDVRTLLVLSSSVCRPVEHSGTYRFMAMLLFWVADLRYHNRFYQLLSFGFFPPPQV